jgi:hypothetical protein
LEVGPRLPGVGPLLLSGQEVNDSIGRQASSREAKIKLHSSISSKKYHNFMVK